jgi:hypothetical protein
MNVISAFYGGDQVFRYVRVRQIARDKNKSDILLCGNFIDLLDSSLG